tara:strand:- start:820 stop:990 length:171 start_codon:yes stop_codon:yes gene_type:complete
VIRLKKKLFLYAISIILLSNCTAAVTTADMAVTGVSKTVGTVVHFTTCPFTKKECF